LPDHPSFKALGLEPLGNELSGERLATLFKGRKTPLKAALLDQSLVAGLGNIYVCEALNMARLSPKRLAGTLARKTGAATPAANQLADDIKAVLTDAIRAGGSSLRDHKLTDGSLGYFQHHFRVYDREGEPCPTPGCDGIVKRIVQSGRSTFYCPTCQK
jgi:formamidopyrimidine-DNA glycosylase